MEPLFATDDKLWLLRGILSNLVDKHQASLYGYALMPNHIHLLLQLMGGIRGLGNFVRDFKSLSARQLYPACHGIWMPRYDELTIVSERQFRVKLEYIHNNPVKAGLADEPQHYKFSSAKLWMDERSGSLIEVRL